jgi:hypothetical protein
MWKWLKKFIQDRRAISVGGVIILAVGFFLAAVLIPMGMNQIGTANTSYWDPTAKTILISVFPILVIVGLAIRFLPFGKKGEG